MLLVGGSVLVLFRDRLSQALEAALFWVLVGFALVFAYTYRGDLREVGERVMAELDARPRSAAGATIPSRSCAVAPAISRRRPW